MFPSADELRAAADREHKSKDVSKKATILDHFGLAKEIAAAKHDQKCFSEEIFKQWKAGAVGWIPSERDDNVGRFMFDNYNSIAPWGKKRRKIHDYNNILRKFQPDCALGCELQVQWDLALRENKDLRLAKLLWPESEKRVAIGYNHHEKFHRSQHGGTSAAAFGRLTQFVQSLGSDPHGLGRWTWLQVGSGSTSTRIVSAYLPCTSNSSKRQTVYNQHRRYFAKLGDSRCPRSIFVQHLGEQISLWKQAGENVIVFVDANSDVYDGILAQRLSQDDIRMEEQCRKVWGHKSPNSHHTGSLPITGVFATANIKCLNAFQSAHGFSIGDHRTFIIDFDLTTVLGTQFQKLARLPGRRLQAKKQRIRKAYNRFLRKHVRNHKVIEKYENLQDTCHNLSTAFKQTAIDKLDTVKTEGMIGGEKRCSKKRMGKLEHSPLISKWDRRVKILRWIKRHLEAPLRDVRNLLRSIRVFNEANPGMSIKDPREYSLVEVEAQIVATQDHINSLEDAAPELRAQHLRRRLKVAKDKGLEGRAKSIADIISREAVRDRFRNLKATTKPRKGGRKVYAVESTDDEGNIQTYSTKEAVERVAGATIEERYKLAYSAPIMQNEQLLADVGMLGDGASIRQILTGTYVFPPDTDEYTKLLLTEAAVLFCSLGGDGVVDWMHSSDFQYFWLHAREATESSKSRLHFGHYMAAAHDPILTRLHVTSLNTIRECGVSPTRWKSSLTVLLEKVFGVRLISKLRAICLLEADFNWLNKLIFARRLEQHCKAHGIIPAEQFCKSKSNCEEASLVKNLVCDNANILHNTFGITSVDFDQCFDRGNVPIASVAAQAHGVSLKSTKLMLSTMQLMQYFIKSGFGIAETPSFGGTVDSPLMGLGQGSGAAPMGMRCIVTLADLAYKRLGHGMSTNSSITARIFLLAAIIYVDDTDLLHWASEYGISDEDFIADVQAATMDWGMIVQSTGGSIKQPKSFWYLLSWKFKRGVPTLKQPNELPTTSLYIPQPGSSPAAIPRQDNLHTAKTLGVWSNPVNDPTVPLDKLREKGLDWVDKLRARPLERRDTRLSLVSQQYPRWSYGLNSLYASPNAIDDTMGTVYRQALSYLGFNKNLPVPYRTLPRRYQGANLRLWSIEKLGKDIAVLLQHWESNSTLGNAMRLVYESFLMEVGLEGNVFTRPFNKLQALATHSWFKILWQYCDYHQVKLTFDSKWHIPLTRVGDRALIELFLEQGCPMEDLIRLNRVRKHLRVHSLADILMADGKTVDKENVMATHQAHSTRTFSWESPTKSDFTLWRHHIRSITSTALQYPSPLGIFTAPPHRPYAYTASADSTFVYHQTSHSTFDTYQRSPSSRLTRSGHRYYKISTSTGSPPAQYYASITNHANDTLTLQSTHKAFTPSTNPSTFLGTLFSLSNATLWDNLEIDEGGEWIIHAIINKTLVICSDGSYMPELSKAKCSGAFILHCTATRKEARGCFVDEAKDASNYRGELLGAIGPLLLIQAAINSNPDVSIDLTTVLHPYCDNKGVISHGNDPNSPLKTEQKQADLIRLIKTYSRDLPCCMEWLHVNGHADKFKRFEDLSLAEQLNVRCDSIAKATLRDSISSGDAIIDVFPNEKIVVEVGGSKIRSSVRAELYREWGQKSARQIFNKTGKVSLAAFDLIHWDSVDGAMSTFPDTFQDWTTRHISDFNGCNRYLSRWRKGITNVCNSCGQPNEDTKHITRCRHPIRTELFLDGVKTIATWLADNYTPAPLRNLIVTYLNARGNSLMTDLVSRTSPYNAFAVDADEIGFDNIIVGRLPSSLREIMQPTLQLVNRRGITVDYWMKELVKQLLLFTHRQWTHRNNITHYKPAEGKTLAEHEMIDRQVKDLMQLDPTDLPLHHQHLLLKENFNKLGASSTTAKQFWIADVSAALHEAAISKQITKQTTHRRKTTRGQNVQNNRDIENNAVGLIPPSLVPTSTTTDSRHKQRRTT